MKKPLAVTAIALTGLGASLGLLAGPAAADAPCPPSVCRVIDTPIVRNSGIRDLIDWAWDQGMQCVGDVRRIGVDPDSEYSGPGAGTHPGTLPHPVKLIAGLGDEKSLIGSSDVGASCAA